MRERRTFAERTRVLPSDEVRRKYFLVYEGTDTEDLYFNAVSSMRAEIGINPLIELVPIIRSYSEEGWSNPKKILDRIIETIEESRKNYISYESLLNRIMDYFYETGVIKNSKVQAKNIWKSMCKICEERLNKTLDTDVEDVEGACNLIFEGLQKEYDLIHVVSDISEILKEGGITYAEGFDKICLIVDRDKKSFLSKPENNQYAYVVRTCREKGFDFFITNPCFEFWLLLHFNEVFALDREMLLENPKVTAKRRYVEQELRRICPKYEKNAYRVEDFMRFIDRAIENEKKFCEDVEKLEHEIGSNIGILIKKLRKND